jgi:uncharacterized protein (UPF0147 family)
MDVKRSAWLPVVAGLITLWTVSGCQQAPSPADLAREALQAATADEQELAAVTLEHMANDPELDRPLRDEVRQALRQVLKESSAPAVRAACIRALSSQWDYQSMPAFLDALDDPSEVVRGLAAAALEHMMSVTLKGFGYDYRAPPATQAAAIKRIRDYWDEKRESPIFINWIKKKKQAQ